MRLVFGKCDQWQPGYIRLLDLLDLPELDSAPTVGRTLRSSCNGLGAWVLGEQCGLKYKAVEFWSQNSPRMQKRVGTGVHENFP